MTVDVFAAALAALCIGLLGGVLIGRRFVPIRPSSDSCANNAADARLRAVLDSAPGAVLINTRAGENLYHNAPAADCFKVDRARFAETGVTALFVNPEVRDGVIERLYATGSCRGEEALFRRGDGDVYTGSVNSSLIDYAGRRCHITWFYDLTERQQADATRRDLAERLEMALDATNAAVWDADLVTGSCWWSDSFPRMLGYREVPPMPPDFWEMRLHPEDRERVLGHIGSHLRGETPDYAYDYRLRREDGGWMWIAAQGRAVRDADGRAVRYLGIMTDITERRRQEERLRVSEARLLRILETSPVAVNITHRDGRWVFCNAQSEVIHGRPREELLRTPAPELYADPADRAALVDRFERDGAFCNAEVRFRRPDGSIRWVLATWNRIDLDGHPEGDEALLTWLYDITDRKAAESAVVAAMEDAEQALADLRTAQESLIQAETMASLGQLVAGVAHEINTPIGIGLTAASHVGEQTKQVRALFDAGTLRKSTMAEYLDSVSEGAHLLVANINRAASLVQSFKQVAVDQSSGERRSFALDRYIGEVLFSLRPRLKRTALAVVVDCPEGLMLDSFPGALSQVLTNLVINALVHAYREGDSGTIRISARLEGEDGVVIDFSDDGCGITPEHLPKVFDPFFTTKRAEGGSGLGLHIVNSTVTGVLGGMVEARSVLGLGTEFTLRLPRVAPALGNVDEGALLVNG